KVYGSTIFTKNTSTVTLNCSYQDEQWNLEWRRQVNGSKQLQLSQHTAIIKDLPKELYARLEVYVKDSSRYYYLIIHDATTADEGEYVCSDNNEKE
ncbi:Hypothetical predicted protein, partial [Mytilus galloprovincialis]